MYLSLAGEAEAAGARAGEAEAELATNKLVIERLEEDLLAAQRGALPKSGSGVAEANGALDLSGDGGFEGMAAPLSPPCVNSCGRTSCSVHQSIRRRGVQCFRNIECLSALFDRHGVKILSASLITMSTQCFGHIGHLFRLCWPA